MERQIIDPGEALKAFVMCYWNLESPKEQTPKRNTIVPDGTMKMIFHYGDKYRHYPEKGESFLLPRSF